MNTYQLADSSRRGCARVGRGLNCANVAAHKYGHVARADILFSEEGNIRSFDHRICGFHSSDETFGLDHSECF